MNDPKQTRSHYIHRIQYTTQERLVGLFILTGIVIIITLLFLSGRTQQLFQSHIEFVAYIQNASGVSTDTKVRISGIEAGYVKQISLTEDNRFAMKLAVYKDFRNLVRIGSTASISKLSFIGDSVINITPGTLDQPLIVDGGIIDVEETLTLDEIVSNLKPVLDKINVSIDKIANVASTLPGEAIEKTIRNTAETTEQLKTIAQQITSDDSTLGKLVFDDSIYKDLNTTLQELRNMVTDFQNTAKNTNIAAEELPNIMRQFAEITRIIRAEVEELPELSVDTRELLDDMQTTVDAISRTWPVSSKIPNQEDTTRVLDIEPSHD